MSRSYTLDHLKFVRAEDGGVAIIDTKDGTRSLNLPEDKWIELVSSMTYSGWSLTMEQYVRDMHRLDMEEFRDADR